MTTKDGKTPKKNVIYIMADSLRPDFLGCYGGDPLTTEIDRLAENGVLFENVVSAAPWTVPSVSSHSTGIYPHNLQIFTPDVAIDEWADTIFERFKDEGYSTAAYFDSERRRNQFEEGVDHYGWSYDIEDHLDFISEHSDERFLTFNLYRGTHLPYVLKYSRESWFRAKDELMEKLRHGGETGIEEAKYRYARSIEQFSEWYLRAIVDRLEDEGILGETAIIITGDHGEHWGRRMEDQSKIGLFDLHGPLLYDEVLKVPLVMYNVGSAEGIRIEEMVRSVDILPTLLDSFGMSTDTDAQYRIDGKSLQPCVDGEQDRAEFPEVAFSSTTSSFDEVTDREISMISKVSVVRDGFKLIYTRDEDRKELYDLSADPEEQNDLSEEKPELAEELMTLIHAEVDAEDFGTSAEQSREIQEQLEDLGYL